MPTPRSSCRWMLRLLGSIALALLFARGAAATPAYSLVYALRQVNGGANQIYGFRLDMVTGVLTALPGFPIATGGTGGGVTVSEQMAYRAGRLFAVNDGDDTLSVFDVNRTSGALTPLPFSPFFIGSGFAWAAVAVHPSGSPVIVGNAATGLLRSFIVTPATITEVAGSPFPMGGAYPFSIAFSRDGHYVYAGGAFGTAFAGFSVTVGTGVLTALPGSPFDSGNTFPASYATDAAGRLFTAALQNASDVRAFTTAGGVPTAVSGNPFPAAGLNQPVYGVVHPAGFYIVAARTNGLVGVFQIAGSGAATTLTAVAGSPFTPGGSNTNTLALTTDGRLLVAGNGGSRNLTVFHMNSGTGLLASLGIQPANTLGASGLITGLSAVLGLTPTQGDFDGDAASDFSIYRPSTGLWATLKSSTSYTSSSTVSWGLSTDKPVPGDYDGDGRIDPAIYRPSTGLWAFLKSSTNYTTSATVSWGLSTDKPVPGDYDGDGKTDPAIYRPSTGLWAFLKSSTNFTSSGTVSWGLSTDVPLAGEYDGDGKADPAIYRPSTGLWAFLKSSTSFTTSGTVSWGLSTDVPVPGDYDGDGRTDPAIFRPSTGLWAFLKSSTNYTTSTTTSWGLSTDVPAPADYDGDDRFDPAVYRPSTGSWFVLKSSTNFTTSFGVSWGLSTDVPINKRPQP